MDEQQLRAEAIKRFPKGTRFKNDNLIPTQTNTIISSGKIARISMKENVVVMVTNTGGHYTVYKNGNWAIPIESLIIDSSPLIFN